MEVWYPFKSDGATKSAHRVGKFAVSVCRYGDTKLLFAQIRSHFDPESELLFVLCQCPNHAAEVIRGSKMTRS